MRLASPVAGAALGATSPATCWAANARRQQNAGERVPWGAAFWWRVCDGNRCMSMWFGGRCYRWVLTSGYGVECSGGWYGSYGGRRNDVMLLLRLKSEVSFGLHIPTYYIYLLLDFVPTAQLWSYHAYHSLWWVIWALWNLSYISLSSSMHI